MKPNPQENDSRQQPGARLSVSRTLARLAVLGLLFLGNQAMAAYTYRLEGAVCTDSNRPEIFYPEAGVFGPGPTLCADQVFAEITMKDSYVPGTFFQHTTDDDLSTLKVGSMFVNDGARPVTTTFPGGQQSGFVLGTLPESEGTTLLRILWHEGWFFETFANGTWSFGVEFGAREGVCGIGSIEGPNIDGTACVPTDIRPHYISVGTYKGWRLVPEPAGTAALALAFAVVGGRRFRRR